MATNCNSFASLYNNHLWCSKSFSSNKLFPVSFYDPCSVSSASNIPDLEICTSGIITTAASSASKKDTVYEFFKKKALFYKNICDTNITKGLIGARDLLDPITYTNFYGISCIPFLTMTLTLPLLFGVAGPAVASDGVRRMLTSTAFLANTPPSGKLMQLMVAVLGMFSGATNVAITTLPLMVNAAQMAKILPILVPAMLLLPPMVQQLLSRSASMENSGGDKEAQESASMVNTLPMAKILPLLVVVQRLLPILLLLPILQQLRSPSVEISGGDKAAHEQNNTTGLLGNFSLILNKLGFEIMQHFMDLKVGVLFNPMNIKAMDLNATAKKVVLLHIIIPFLNKKGCDILQHIVGSDFTNVLISFAFFYVLLCIKGALERS